MNLVLSTTKNGQLFRLKKSGDFIVQFKNRTWYFTKFQLLKFKDHIANLNLFRFSKFKFEISISESKVFTVLNINEFLEVKELLSCFKLFLYDPNDIYDNLYLEKGLKTDKVEKGFDYKIIVPEITAFGQN